MVRGLKEVDALLAQKRIPMYLLTGEPQDTVPQLVTKLHPAAGRTLHATSKQVYSMRSILGCDLSQRYSATVA